MFSNSESRNFAGGPAPFWALGQIAPIMIVVGLPDAAVKESKDWVTAAIVNSGYLWPQTKTTVNLAPAHSLAVVADSECRTDFHRSLSGGFFIRIGGLPCKEDGRFVVPELKQHGGFLEANATGRAGLIDIPFSWNIFWEFNSFVSHAPLIGISPD